MEIKEKTEKRNHLITWVKGLLAIAIGGIFIFRKSRSNDPIKMLTQDGQLVEIDPRAKIKQSGKINSTQIHNWIKKNKI